MVITPSPAMIGDNVSKRGAFILLEGIDRCGKTTQCSLLVKHLLSLSIAALALRFPDRTTTVGKVIDQYLKSSPTVDGKKGAVDDRAIHLLFSANRWEAVPSILETLGNGVNIVCDRYAYSGVAFSSAKTREDMDVATASAVRAMGRLGDDMEGLDLEWCMAPDRGLPAPDCVIFLNLSQDESEKRGGYGGERYEKRELQLRVRRRFQELQMYDEQWKRVQWYIIDASQSVEKVQEDINKAVEQTLTMVEQGKPLSRMFEDGVYHLKNDGTIPNENQ